MSNSPKLKLEETSSIAPSSLAQTLNNNFAVSKFLKGMDQKATREEAAADGGNLSSLPARLPSIVRNKVNLKHRNLSKLNITSPTEGSELEEYVKGLKTEGNEASGQANMKSVQLLSQTKLNEPSYDYKSYLLMFIPQDIHSINTKTSGSPFNSFNQLSMNTKNSHQDLFEGAIKSGVTSPKQSESPKRMMNSFDNMESVRKVLELNKLQKKYYSKQIEVEKKNVVLPLIQQVREVRTKKKRMPPVKVFPSKHSHHGNTVEVTKDAQNSMESPEINGFFDGRGSFYNTQTDSRASKQDISVKPGEDMLIEHLVSKLNYKIFWMSSYLNKNSWKPCAREGHTFTTVGKQIILYGGISHAVIPEINLYNPASNTWNRPQVSGDVPPGRHGHSACEYRKSLVVFGGEHEFNPALNFRECLNNIYFFSPERNEWKYIKPMSNSINPRRHHTACVYDSNMYVYGGVTSEGTYLKDLWSFNLSKGGVVI